MIDAARILDTADKLAAAEREWPDNADHRRWLYALICDTHTCQSWYLSGAVGRRLDAAK